MLKATELLNLGLMTNGCVVFLFLLNTPLYLHFVAVNKVKDYSGESSRKNWSSPISKQVQSRHVKEPEATAG